ncbi:hypothetical protein ACFS5N_08895 [Mucilaginibacter ximonensis]|uniref:Uncharacterized protein n=1 Tax=Mucilaginibacter ximonensis TaxID=538021 RepID=A0ABW5YCN3_9SPHI
MRFDLKHILKLSGLMLLCCAFFCAKAAPVPAAVNDNNAKVIKLHSANNQPATPLIKFNLIAGNQEFIRQVHKTNSPVFTAYLATPTTNTCIRYFNYFSGYNNHRYTLQNADFLFPFHVFW